MKLLYFGFFFFKVFWLYFIIIFLEIVKEVHPDETH